jgi:hypothetical protein
MASLLRTSVAVRVIGTSEAVTERNAVSEGCEVRDCANNLDVGLCVLNDCTVRVVKKTGPEEESALNTRDFSFNHVWFSSNIKLSTQEHTEVFDSVGKGAVDSSLNGNQQTTSHTIVTLPSTDFALFGPRS